MKKIIYILFKIVFGISLNSCNKDSNATNNYPYNVHITNASWPFDKVNIDLQAVEVTGIDGQIVILNTVGGIYNLLKISNGLITLIVNSTLHNSNIVQIWLILGLNNSVDVNGTIYSLSTPSAEQSGLKFLVNQTLQADIQNEILINFDANASIIQTGNGTYKLKPVLRTIITAISGNIKGSIKPIGTLATVTATSSKNVVYSSIVNDRNQFQISWLPLGAYTFLVTTLYPLLPITQLNVIVVAGETTNLGTITL